MKKTKRIVSVNVNGKKVDIRFFIDSEITEKVEKEEGALLCHFCKLKDLCNNDKLKNPLLLDNDSSFSDFCISGGIIGKYDYNSRLSLSTIKKEFPELYEEIVANYFEIKKKHTTLKEIGDDNYISILGLITIGDIKFFDVMPSYEDVEPILEDLKKSDEKDHMPIVSVGKDITQEEFSQQYYLPGKVYRINNGLLHKCTGYTPEGRPIIDTICFILQPDSHSGYQIIKDINAEGDVIPGLDFVNKRMSGEIREIDPNIWDRIDDLCCSLCKDLQEIIKK